MNANARMMAGVMILATMFACGIIVNSWRDESSGQRSLSSLKPPPHKSFKVFGAQ